MTAEIAPRAATPSPDPAPRRRVYALVGVPPEIQSYAMAKYSRSAQSMLQSVREISAQKAEQFLDTFYFQYGHRSIADMAHLVLAVEDVSILAAIALVDEPLWDGQERSTRYQDFSRSGYELPAEVRAAGQEAAYRREADALFAAYARLSERLAELLGQVVPRPEDMGEPQYRRTLRARAFDVARGLLPLATRTSVGQIVSARVAERQISRLLADRFEEVRALGADLRRACQEPAEQPLGAGLGEVRAAPTLVKYTEPDEYARRTYAEFAAAAAGLTTPPVEERPPVVLTTAESPLQDALATLLYRADPLARPYRALVSGVRVLPEPRRRALLALSVRHRGRRR